MLVAALAGCSPYVLAAKETYEVATDPRSLSTQATDTEVEGLIKAAVRSAIHRERMAILTRWPSDACGYSADAPFVFMPGELETDSNRDSRDELWPITDRAAVFTFRDVT